MYLPTYLCVFVREKISSLAVERLNGWDKIRPVVSDLAGGVGRWIADNGSGNLFECDVCGKQFTNPKSKINHLGLHRGLTSCRHCRKTFATTSSLNQHLRYSQCGHKSAIE